MSAPPSGGGVPIENRRQLIEYFAAGNKPRSAWRMGTEHEKFGFHKATLKPLAYDGPDGIRALLEGMTRFGWKPVIEKGNIIALSNLPRHILTQGTAIFSLMRNIGGSVGISIVEALLAENTQTVHSRLVEHLRPDNPLAQAQLTAPYSLTNPSGVAALNAMATRQAAMVAYIDDFKLMMIIIIIGLPLLLLLRKPQPAPRAAAAAAE